MPIYEVDGNLDHNNTKYKTGDQVEMNEDQAAPLLAIKRIKLVEQLPAAAAPQPEQPPTIPPQPEQLPPAAPPFDPGQFNQPPMPPQAPPADPNQMPQPPAAGPSPEEIEATAAAVDGRQEGPDQRPGSFPQVGV